MTEDEIQAAKTAVEAARFGTLVEPSGADLQAFRAEANAEAALATAADLPQIAPIEENCAKPTLQGR